MRIAITVLLTALVTAGGLYGYDRTRAEQCYSQCGEGTQCNAGLCVPAESPAPTKKRRKRSKRKRRSKKRTQGELKQPSAADLRPTTRGPSLRGNQIINMNDEPQGRALSDADVTTAMRRLDPRILQCIEKARGEYNVGGKIKVGLRVERSGNVRKVRVTGPAIMQRQGLTSCVTRVVKSLKFGAIAQSVTMTFPYKLY